MAVDQGEGVDEFIPGNGFVVSIGDGEVRARDEAGAEGHDKKRAGEEQRFCGGSAGNAGREVG